MQRVPLFAMGLLAALALGLAGCASNGEAGDKGATVEGTIADVKPPLLTVRTADGRELRFTVDADSRLRLRDHAANLSELPAGTSIRVTYDETRDGKKRVVAATADPVTTADLKKKVQETLEAARNYTYDRKDEYAQKLQGVADDLNKKIAELKVQAEQAGAEAKARLQPQIDELRRKSETVQKQLDKVKAATPAVWNDIKSGVNKALEELQDAFEKARERLK